MSKMQVYEPKPGKLRGLWARPKRSRSRKPAGTANRGQATRGHRETLAGQAMGMLWTEAKVDAKPVGQISHRAWSTNLLRDGLLAIERQMSDEKQDTIVAQHREELEMVKRVMTLVDGYISTQPEDLLLAWDGGVMTWGELRMHISAALKAKVLNAAHKPSGDNQ